MANAGPKNRVGPQGEPGQNGIDGVNPTIKIGEVRSGSRAQVWNTGTEQDVVLNFILPKGDKGDKGQPGKDGRNGSGGGWQQTIPGTGSGGGSGISSDPFTELNIKIALPTFYYLIKSHLENVVTVSQVVDGVLTIDGVNTIL